MAYELDEKDRKIIALLRENGRSTNVSVARQIGITEGTVRKRIDRLLSRGVMKVIAAVDPRKLGYRVEAFVSIEADIDKIEAAADALAVMEEVQYVGILTGASDIFIKGLFMSDDELYDFLNRKIVTIPGIRKTVTSHVLKVVKRAYEMMR